MSNKKQSGFTFIELLVTVTIMAILVTVGTASYNSAQKRSRDSRRKIDMAAIRDALEQYYSANSFAYPNGTCSNASAYIKGSWPSDPGTLSYSQTCALASFCVCAQMEISGAGNSSNTSCSWGGTNNYYCVSNTQ